ncbi:MAG: hypothetical protein GY865_17465, partial [candidate division Zixibacteria bacterium]|nr:hypothetical protein [candidate division Zixibacteria bacterium]
MLKRIVILICGLLILTSTTIYSQCEPASGKQSCASITCPNPINNCVPVGANFDFVTGDYFVLECNCLTPDECYVELPTGGLPGCVIPDNGSGTANLPPLGCQYESLDDVWMIIDGLPPGTTIEMVGILYDFNSIVSGPGGSLGGEFEQFDALLDLTVSGTGDLTGFNRHLSIPLSCETHSGPRNPGDATQIFPAVMYQLQGQLFGDPDFCTFNMMGGTNYGLPSPGETKLRELPSGHFAVESFFDVTYQIEFEGCPGSILEGLSGVTTATIRIQTGEIPACV